MHLARVLFALTLICANAMCVAQPGGPAALALVGQRQCPDAQPTCETFDAVVFVHGIYGTATTFRNANGFDWPANFSQSVERTNVDVFLLNYETELLSWAKGKSPTFLDLSNSVLDAMALLRKRRYRSIGFIAHSLGGNVVSTYIHRVETKIGHPQRSQHAFVITLATPVLGSQIANIAGPLKRLLQMDDDLLRSLTVENLYL